MVNGNVSLNASYVMPYYVDVSIDPSKSSKMQLEIQIELVPSDFQCVQVNEKHKIKITTAKIFSKPSRLA